MTAIDAPVRVGWRRGGPAEGLVSREWLLTNGLGGYASGTIGGAPTRRFHGLLIAALPAPIGRLMMLNHLSETVHLAAGDPIQLSGFEPIRGPLVLPEAIAEFRLDNGRPVWRFEAPGMILEKRILLTYNQNTVHVSYKLIAADGPVTLVLEPAFAMRRHDGRVDVAPGEVQLRKESEGLAVVMPDHPFPPLHLLPRPGQNARFDASAPHDLEVAYRTERARGYDWEARLRVVGAFHFQLTPGADAVLTASTESWECITGPEVAEATRLDDARRSQLLSQASLPLRQGVGAELVLAADQFVISPLRRPEDHGQVASDNGIKRDDARTIIAGYPWFTDWGRDTMISLEGLTLLTGRHAEARGILNTFARYIRDGLIPNLFPEGENEGLYHTADATLWFFHALDRYEQATGDQETRSSLLPKLVEIVEKHLTGTHFGIGVDPADGLLRQGAEGYQLTWMDAKVGDWVVTPRRGKAVEINALFYNALRLLERWLAAEEALGTSARPLGLRSETIATHADLLRSTFNRRFWNPATGCLFDVLDGPNDAGGLRDDDSVRPNQLLAISLPNPVLDPPRWVPVLQVVRERLATPFGLRSLAPGHPDFKPRYDGDLRARDAAYHQGTIWGWLIGPFVDAWLRAFPDDRVGARRLLDGLEQELSAACIGTISEIYDAEAPFLPRGCVAQAWSVAEALRVFSLC